MRQVGVGIGDRVDIEKTSAGNVRGPKFGQPVLGLVGEVFGSVEHNEIAPAERTREPIRRNQAAHTVLPVAFSAGRRRVRERYDDPPILPALVLDLDDLYRPDLAGSRDMRAAARLQIDWAVRSTPIRTSRSRPVPRGGLTERVRTSAGFSSSTLSSTQ